MGFSFNDFYADFSNDFITVRTAAEIGGYNSQYLRRLLREKTLRSKRIGQLWLIDRDNFIESLDKAKKSTDKRFGPS